MDDDTEIRFESIEDQDVFRVTRAAEDVSEAKAFFARIADVATRLPAETALTLWQGVNYRRWQTRRYFRDVFGCDPQKPGIFSQIREARWPNSERSWDVFADLLRQYRRDNEVVLRMRRSGTFAISEGREPWNDMVDVWIECQDKFVADEADRMGLSRDDKTRKDAALWIAGYAYAHLDVNQNRRLWKEMGPGGRVDRQRRLAQALPGAVFAAWFDGPVYGDVRRLPLEAARILGGDGERKRRPTSKEPDLSYGEIDRKVRRAGLLPDPIPDVDPTSIPQRRGMGPSRAERRRNATRERAELREFQSRELGERFAVGDFEWIEAVNNLKHESGLSDREANVAHACAEYPNLRTGQIGAALGIAEGTVRAHRSRIRSRIKVRRA